MGFPVGCSELPNPLLHALVLLGYIRSIISRAFDAIGLGDLLQPEAPWPEPPAHSHCQPRSRPATSGLIEELLPVAWFAELSYRADICAVCLHELERAAQVRRLRNCCHVFHRCCLDPWVEHGQRTCPLCRAPLFQEEAQYAFDDCDPAAGPRDSSFAEFLSPALLSPHELQSLYN